MKTSMRRFLAVTTSTAVALVGAMAVMGPAEAKKVTTNYSFNGSAYGTYVSTGPVGVKSAPTAFSYLGCTRNAGVSRTRTLASVDTPGEAGLLSVGAVRSKSFTYRKKSGRVGMRSTNKIAKVVLGDPNGLNITIKGLQTRSDAWATRKGKLGSKARFKSVDISANTGTPLDDILNQVGAGIGDLLDQIRDSANNVLTIPGLGAIRIGQVQQRSNKNAAVANAIALRVTLFTEPGQENIRLHVGRSRARIAKGAVSGVMTGAGTAVQGSVNLGGSKLVGIGPLPERVLPCEGTRGKVKKSAIADVDLLKLNQVVVGAVQARAKGRQYRSGRAKAWTEGSVADVRVGEGDTAIHIKGIVARAKVVRTKNGKFRKSIKGTEVASITIGGEKVKIPLDRTIEIDGVAKIQFNVRSSRKNTIKVTAVRITLLDKTLVLNLGNAKTTIRRA